MKVLITIFGNLIRDEFFHTDLESDMQEAYASFVNDTFADYVDSYNQENLKIITSSNRLWWFQVCTEVAYFQVAPANDSIRSSKVNTRYVLFACNCMPQDCYPCFYFDLVIEAKLKKINAVAYSTLVMCTDTIWTSVRMYLEMVYTQKLMRLICTMEAQR